MEGLARPEAIKKKKDFDRLFRSGRRKSYANLLAIFLKTGTEENQLAVAVKKSQGSAVLRNRARRLIKEAYRLNQKGIKRGYMILIIIKNPLFEKYQQAEKALLNLLERASLLRA